MASQFIPTSLDAISPTLALDDVINRASGRGDHDYKLFRHSDNTFSVGVEGQMMTLEEAQPLIEARASVYERASEDVLEALRRGHLRSYVMRASDLTIWQIPRFYFNRRQAHQLASTPFTEWAADSGEDSSMYGQPILISERQFMGWLADPARASQEQATLIDSLVDARDQIAPPAPRTKAEVDQLCQERYTQAVREGIRFSRRDDEVFLRSLGVSGARDRAREIRKQLAPADWSAKGRPAKTGE